MRHMFDFASNKRLQVHKRSPNTNGLPPRRQSETIGKLKENYKNSRPRQSRAPGPRRPRQRAYSHRGRAKL